MAKNAGQAGGFTVADQNPAEFTGGGLATDFDGTIVEARAVVWNYDNGKGPKRDEKGQIVYGPFTRLRIAREGEDEDIISYYTAGDREQVHPLDETGNPIEIDSETGLGVTEGVQFGLKGRDKMSKGTNHAFLLQNLVDAKFPVEKMRPDLRFLEGSQGHFDRIAPPKRSGAVNRGVREEGAAPAQKPNDILVMSKFHGFVAGGAAPKAAGSKAGPVGVAKPTASAPAAVVSGGTAEKFRAVVVANLPTDGTSLKKGSIASKVMKDPSMTPQERSAAVKLITNDYFAQWAEEEGTAIIFDADGGELYKNAE